MKIETKIKKELSAKYPSLLNEIYQYSRKDRCEVNDYGQAKYIFVLQPEYEFLESLIAERVVDISFNVEHDNSQVTVNCEVETYRKSFKN